MTMVRNMIVLEGFDEAKKMLDELPDKFQKQTLQLMMRKAVKPFIDQAKSNLLNHGAQYHELADAIGYIPTRKTENAVVIAGIRAKGKFKYVGYIGAWVEYGVKGIKRKLSSTVRKEGDESFRGWVGSVKKGERYRDDQPPRPFMRPAADQKRAEVQAMMADQLANRLYDETQRSIRRYQKLKAKGRA